MEPTVTICGAGCPDAVPEQLVEISNVIVGFTVIVYVSVFGQMLTSLGVIVAVTVVLPKLTPVIVAEFPLPETVTIDELADSHAIV